MKGLKTKIRGTKNFILGMVTMALIFSLVSSVSALVATLNVPITYNDIQIQIDGKPTVFLDVNDKPMEPFLLNNIMYVPISPLVRQFGYTSTYDAKAKTLYIGKNKFDWLDQLGFVERETDSSQNTFSLYSNDTYDRGIRVYVAGSGSSTQKITYRISGKYDKFYTTLTGAKQNDPMTIRILGDFDKVLYTAIVDKNTKPIDITIDVSGNEFIYFETSVSGGFLGSWKYGEAILGNARFSFK